MKRSQETCLTNQAFPFFGDWDKERLARADVIRTRLAVVISAGALIIFMPCTCRFKASSGEDAFYIAIYTEKGGASP